MVIIIIMSLHVMTMRDAADDNDYIITRMQSEMKYFVTWILGLVFC